MIKIENTVTPSGEQWKRIIMGLRNPMNSWDKSDSGFRCKIDDGACNEHNCEDYGKCNSVDKLNYRVGKNDLSLMKKLSKAGTDHRKFMRMIVVYADITAPQFWWSEFDTYKVGTVRNSCSKMHKIHVKEFVKDDFSHEGIDEVGGIAKQQFEDTINVLEWLRLKFNETGEKKYWRALIQMLPSSYNQKSTVMLNYEVLANMYHSRKAHKLDEWREFCEWVKTLPYSDLITN